MVAVPYSIREFLEHLAELANSDRESFPDDQIEKIVETLFNCFSSEDITYIQITLNIVRNANVHLFKRIVERVLSRSEEKDLEPQKHVFVSDELAIAAVLEKLGAFYQPRS